MQCFPLLEKKIIFFCPGERTLNTPSTQMMVSKCPFPTKKKQLPGEMGEFRSAMTGCLSSPWTHWLTSGIRKCGSQTLSASRGDERKCTAPPQRALASRSNHPFRANERDRGASYQQSQMKTVWDTPSNSDNKLIMRQSKEGTNMLKSKSLSVRNVWCVLQVKWCEGIFFII